MERRQGEARSGPPARREDFCADRNAAAHDARRDEGTDRGPWRQGGRGRVEENALRGGGGRSRRQARKGAGAGRRGARRGGIGETAGEEGKVMKITKAVFPVAGMGTRFLPATKARPKETLAVVDKPLLQYAVEEAVAAGMTEMIFVTGRGKRAIEDHFDRAVELEAELAERGRDDLLKIVRDILPRPVSGTYVRQAHALGLR